MSESAINVRLKMMGQRAFVKGTDASAKSVDKFGASGKRAARGLGATTRASKLGASALTRAGAAAGGAAAAYLSISGAKRSIDVTSELAKTTLGLHNNLGLALGTAAQWASVAKNRGVDAKALNMSFGTLSKTLDAATDPASKQAEAFKRLGLSHSDVVKGQTDFNSVLFKTADGFKAMGAGPERTALSMKLFGRGWQSIVPLMRDGSVSMRESLDLVDKYGASVAGLSKKEMTDLISSQRESKLATLGLQVAMGTVLAPALTKVLTRTNEFVKGMRSGTGAGGDFAETAGKIWKDAKPIVFWFGRATKNVAQFAAEHPTVTKLATAIGLTGVAVNAIRTSRAVSGISTLLGSLRKLAGTKAGESAAESIAGPGGLGGLRGRLTKPLSRARDVMRRMLGRAGTTAGTNAATNAATGLGSSIGPQMRSKRTTFHTVGKNTGRVVGGSLGSQAAKTGAAAMVGESAAGAAGAGGGLAGAAKARKEKFKAIGKNIGRGIGAGIALGVLLAADDIEVAVKNATGFDPKDFGGKAAGKGSILGPLQGINPLRKEFWTGGSAMGGLISPLAGASGKGHPAIPKGEDTLRGLQFGEFVMRKSAVKRFGVEAMRTMNAGQVPAMAGGGPVVPRVSVRPQPVATALKLQRAEGQSDRPILVQNEIIIDGHRMKSWIRKVEGDDRARR